MNAQPVPQPVPLTALARFALLASQAAKGVVGVSGVLAVVVANAYPSYNVLKFSNDSGEKALAHLAHSELRAALGNLLFSMLFGLVSFGFVLCFTYEDTHSQKREFCNRLWTGSVLIVFSLASAFFAWRGFEFVTDFFTQSA